MRPILHAYQQKLFLCGVILLLPLFLFSQAQKKSRILFLLDASSSMTNNWNPGYSRYEVASNILLRIIDSVYAVNNEIEFAVRAYGTQYPAQEKNCTDTRLEVPFNIQNVAQIKTRLKNLQPIGFSPIAYSLVQASQNELSDAAHYDYSIIFITDGGESCLGDVCKTFQDFLAKKIKVKPYIIGLDKNEQLDLLYSCMGNFINVKERNDIDVAVKMIVDANRPLLEKPKLLNLNTTYANPPVIKEIESTPPPVIKKGNPFPRLSIIPYRVKNRDLVVMKAVYLILNKPEAVTLHMNFEENVVQPLQREQDVMPRIIASRYRVPGRNAANMTGKAMALKNLKTTLKFDIETDPPPVVRKNDVFPALRSSLYRPGFKAVARVTDIARMRRPADKASLTLEWEEPVQRTTNILPRLLPATYTYTPGKNGIALKGRTFAYNRNEKATIRLEWEEPVVRKTGVLPRLFAATYKGRSITADKPLTATRMVLSRNEKATLRFDIEEKKKAVLTFIAPEKYPMRYSYAYRLPSLNQSKAPRGKAIIRFDANDIGVVKKKDTPSKKVVVPPPASNNSEFTVEAVPSEETKVQIFFLGRDGKRYPNATPEIQVSDAVSKQNILSFHRQVSGGEPVPQKINAGKYNFVVTGYNALYLNGVNIEPNKLNKVTIKVTEGTLSFAYIGNRNKPIEYSAIVNRRFAAGATILQKCTDRLPYEPGTYYVEINTMPASKFSIDMSFGALYELQIPEPGTLQFTNETPVGKVQLQCMIGDQYLTFHSMMLDGNVSKQTLKMQPGFYKVIFPQDPRMPQAGTKVLDFKISSNMNTMLELK